MISSLIARAGLPYWGAYGPSKFAVECITDTLRQEWADQGITVCAINPGIFQTPIVDKAIHPDSSEQQLVKEMEPYHYRIEESARNFYREAFPFYQTSLQWSLTLMNQPVQWVVNGIKDGLFQCMPPYKTLIGVDAWILGTLSWFLPERMVAWIYRAMMAKEGAIRLLVSKIVGPAPAKDKKDS